MEKKIMSSVQLAELIQISADRKALQASVNRQLDEIKKAADADSALIADRERALWDALKFEHDLSEDITWAANVKTGELVDAESPTGCNCPMCQLRNKLNAGAVNSKEEFMQFVKEIIASGGVVKELDPETGVPTDITELLNDKFGLGTDEIDLAMKQMGVRAMTDHSGKKYNH